MLLKNETKLIQEQLARYCKTGLFEPIPGVQEDRVRQYRRLVLNVVADTLETAFPITEEWLSEEEWKLLVSDFFSKHEAQTPSVWKLPKEFAEFVIVNNYAKQLKKPALNDLLKLEWFEIDVHTMSDTKEPIDKKMGFKINQKITINPYHKILQLQFPVHQLNADEAATHEGNYYVLIYRLIDTGQVRFMQLSALHAFLINKLNGAPVSLQHLLPLITSISGLDQQIAAEHLSSFCTDLIEKGVLFMI